jgi:glutamyl/glutaminyl-tRNA synthetase
VSSARLDFASLDRQFRGRPRTRFAPAPTGWLHLGHVLNARWVWEAAGALGGEVLLRIEDHDRERSRPEFEAGILDDLDWLGFAPDIHPTSAFRSGRCDGRQSDRDHVYREAFASLRSRGLVYACDCTRKEIAAAGGEGDELRYPGTCRDRGIPIEEGVGWRVRMDAGVETFDDARLGPQAQSPAEQCGDLLVRDRRGNWTYQFCVTVDDWRQDVDLVIRGTDLLASTGRQIRLARLLGRVEPPVFLHHPLVMKAPGQKLSKSDRDTGIRDLRARGLDPRAVLALARSESMPNGKWQMPNVRGDS